MPTMPHAISCPFLRCDHWSAYQYHPLLMGESYNIFDGEAPFMPSYASGSWPSSSSSWILAVDLFPHLPPSLGVIQYIIMPGWLINITHNYKFNAHRIFGITPYAGCPYGPFWFWILVIGTSHLPLLGVIRYLSYLRPFGASASFGYPVPLLLRGHHQSSSCIFV